MKLGKKLKKGKVLVTVIIGIILIVAVVTLVSIIKKHSQDNNENIDNVQEAPAVELPNTTYSDMQVTNINMGMSNILVKLNQKYNSYSKSYEKCKSITLYNDNDTKELVDEEDNSEDVRNITPMLYDIAQRVRQTLEEYRGMVNKVYITGDAVIINNIDLYFEGLLDDVRCEILKPTFIANNPNIANKIKDYVEVNSAIALATFGGKIKGQNVNFNANGQLKEQFEDLKSSPALSKVSELFGKVTEKINSKTSNESSERKFNFELKIGNSTLILQIIL